jgi:membrane associated rhomboid family serine protease
VANSGSTAGEPEPAPRAPRPGAGSEPPLDATTWSGALIVMGVVGLSIFLVQVVNATQHYRLNRFGLQPREIRGLWGVLTAPLLHQSYGQMLSDTVPLVAIGWLLLLSGLRTWLTVTAVVIVVGGFATWLVARHGLIVGAGGVVFGWLGYLLARAYFSRKVRWIAAAVVVLFFFGTLLSNLLPSEHVSWESHLCGFLAGILAGAALHPRNPRKRGTDPARRVGDASTSG